MMRPLFCQSVRAGLTLCFAVIALAVILTPTPAAGQQPTNFGSASGINCPGGNVICNGSINFLTTELFFEPETPAFSMKSASTSWNELEQLLDNPNWTYTWGAACNDGAGPVPGNEAGYPTYCTNSVATANNPTGFIRRPTTVDAQGRFLVSTLPPLLIHPLNYSAPTGEEMRLINPNYGGGSFQVSGVVQDPHSVTRTNLGGWIQTGACYTEATECAPVTKNVNVSAGSTRLAPGQTEIDNNVHIGRKLGFCQINPEPVPIYGAYSTSGMSQSTSYDSENLTACGSDPGEPGAHSLAHNNPPQQILGNEPSIIPVLTPAQLAVVQAAVAACAGLATDSPDAGYLCEDNVGLPATAAPNAAWYSVPAVPAPSAAIGAQMQVPNTPLVPGSTFAPNIGTGIVTDPAAGFLLTDPARGGVIQPLDIASGVGGLRKPSLRKADVCGTGLAPNYLFNSAAAPACAAAGVRTDPTGADLQVANENDFVGLFAGPGVAFGTGLAGNGDYMNQKQAARLEAMVLGKSLFWDQQIGSDGVQACGSCHAHAAADNRTKNQINPNGQDGIRGNPTNFAGTPNSVFSPFPVNYDLQRGDFPLLKLKDPDIAGDPLCTPAIQANVTGITFPDGDPPENPKVPSIFTVCDAANQISDTEEVASSMGVHFGLFGDIPAGTGTGLTLTNTPGLAPVSPFGPPSLLGAVRALIHDQRSSTTLVTSGGAVTVTAAQVAIDNTDPIAGFAGTAVNADGSSNQFRRVEPRNTPTIFQADMNFDNFWDGRARHDDNGGSVFGPSDPQSHVWVDQGTGLTATRQLIRFSSLGSLAKGPALSKFEMSFLNRNWAKIGKKLLQPGVTPLANQLVDPTDGILGRYSNQNGSACAALPAAERSPAGGPPTALGTGVPGLCISYPALIQHAFYPALYSNTTQHLNGCYTDGRPDIHPNQCGTGIYPAASIQVLDPDGVVRAHNNDPFDSYVLNLAAGAAAPGDTNQFTQMEANFSLFWGQSIHVWATILVPDDTPDDKFLDLNPDTGGSTGESGEFLLVLDAPSCTNVPAGYQRGFSLSPSNGMLQYHSACFTEVGNFKRDVYNASDRVGTPARPVQGDTTGHPRMSACIDETTVAGARICTNYVPAGGTRTADMPDPLLGFDIFFGSNMSLKNPQFRSARCGACHNSPTLTDNTAAFTVKAMELDGFLEFTKGNPAVEPLIEPLTRQRVITGFLLESEINEPGQDSIERRAPNLGIAPAPVVANNANCTTANCSGYAFPDAVTAKVGPDGTYSDATGYIIHHDLGNGPIAGTGNTPVPFTSFGGAFLDNGVYNIGVRPCVADEAHVTGACEDTGRGNTDPFGWPLSLAALLLKNAGGPAQQPGVALTNFNPSNANVPAGRTDALPCAPYCAGGGLLEMSAQDQHINPGYTDELSNPQLPSYLAHFANKIPVGDAHPQIDEGCGPAGGGCFNTLMDVANEEGFPEDPFDSRAAATEIINSAVAAGDGSFIPGVLVHGNGGMNGPGSTTLNGVRFNNAPSTLDTTAGSMLGYAEMGTWPVVNKVHRFGSFKAPQLREVELTGPYFHNGGKLTLRQVVDFYVRGGDFPVTNSNHRDFNILNLNAELQSDLSEEEKVALVDYMLEFTDNRVALEKSPFDHPQLILPLDGTAPENDGSVNFHDAAVAGTCTPSPLGPGQTACTSGYPTPVGATGPLFLNVPATGAAGNPGGRIPNFLGVAGAAPDAANPGGRQRLAGAAAFCGANITSQYCH